MERRFGVRKGFDALLFATGYWLRSAFAFDGVFLLGVECGAGWSL